MKFGKELILKEPLNNNETDIFWILFLGNVDTVEISKSGIVSRNNRNDKLNNTIKCFPSETSCETLLITSLNKDFIGTYYRYMQTFYEISGYETPFEISCISTKHNRCFYNATINSIYVRENEPTSLTCSVVLWKYSSFDTPVQVHINGCNDSTEERRSLEKKFGLYQFMIKRTCTKIFSVFDKTFSCSLKYSTSARNFAIIENFDVNLDIEYGPINDAYELNYLNKNITQGTELVLNCPLSGHPLKYFWKSSFNTTFEFVGEKELKLPKTLKVGKHNFECKAEIVNSNEPNSETVKFEIIVYRFESSRSHFNF